LILLADVTLHFFGNIKAVSGITQIFHVRLFRLFGAVCMPARAGRLQPLEKCTVDICRMKFRTNCPYALIIKRAQQKIEGDSLKYSIEGEPKENRRSSEGDISFFESTEGVSKDYRRNIEGEPKEIFKGPISNNFYFSVSSKK
jgi:hypothetical protein